MDAAALSTFFIENEIEEDVIEILKGNIYLSSNNIKYE